MAKKKKPLDVGVDLIYTAARRGVQNKESRSTTKKHIFNILSNTNTDNLKLKEKLDKVTAERDEVSTALSEVTEGLEAANEEIRKQKVLNSDLATEHQVAIGKAVKAVEEEKHAAILEKEAIITTLNDSNKKLQEKLTEATKPQKEKSPAKKKDPAPKEEVKEKTQSEGGSGDPPTE
jgi:hypothetical protein